MPLRSSSMLGAVVALSFAVTATGRAQMLGAPVLQNAFTNSGLTIGVDYGSGDRKQSYGGAVAWSPSTGIFQLDAGVAYLHSRSASGTATYGARLMVPCSPERQSSVYHRSWEWAVRTSTASTTGRFHSASRLAIAARSVRTAVAFQRIFRHSTRGHAYGRINRRSRMGCFAFLSGSTLRCHSRSASRSDMKLARRRVKDSPAQPVASLDSASRMR